MVTKSKGSAGKKKGNKDRVRTLNLKRETIKNLSGREQKRIKGGGGLASSVGPHGTDRAGNSGY